MFLLTQENEVNEYSDIESVSNLIKMLDFIIN
jgi:hypothetical protein